MTTPFHGESRNEHEQTDYSDHATLSTSDGKLNLLVSNFTHTYSVADRYCGWCEQWVETRGIIGALVCPQCHHTWDEVPPADLDERRLMDLQAKIDHMTCWDLLQLREHAAKLNIPFDDDTSKLDLIQFIAETKVSR